MEELERLLSDIICGIVKHPNEVQIHVSEDTDERGTMTVMNVKVSREDVGVCIGKGGETAESIRKIIGLVGFRQRDERVYVKIDAPKVPKSHFGYEGS